MAGKLSHHHGAMSRKSLQPHIRKRPQAKATCGWKIHTAHVVEEFHPKKSVGPNKVQRRSLALSLWQHSSEGVAQAKGVCDHRTQMQGGP